jgi:hypothetical protein
MRFIYVILFMSTGSTAFGAQAVSTAPFSLAKRGDQICRIKKDFVDICLPRLVSRGHPNAEQINVRERIRQYGLFLELKKNIPDLRLSATSLGVFGGAIFLSPEQVASTSANFEELIVRDLAVSSASRKLQDGSDVYPFFASLRWKSLTSFKPNGTLFIEGYVKVREGFDYREIFSPKDAAELRREKINQLFEIEGFADSGTEEQISILRNLENLGREVHFRIAGTNGKSVEGATLDLLNQVIAPVVFGDAFWMPEMKKSGVDIAERLQLK